MVTETDTVAFKVMNQDFVKLGRFDVTNFTRWQDKICTYLLLRRYHTFGSKSAIISRIER